MHGLNDTAIVLVDDLTILFVASKRFGHEGSPLDFMWKTRQSGLRTEHLAPWHSASLCASSSLEALQCAVLAMASCDSSWMPDSFLFYSAPHVDVSHWLSFQSAHFREVSVHILNGLFYRPAKGRGGIIIWGKLSVKSPFPKAELIELLPGISSASETSESPGIQWREDREISKC